MFLKTLIIIIFAITLSGCNQEKIPTSDKALYESLNQLRDSLDRNQIATDENFWISKYKEKKYKNSNISLAFIEYHIGRAYLLKNDLKKAEDYVQLAFNRIDQTQGNEELKFRIYDILGYFLYDAKNKLYLSIYYCNKAAYLIQKGNIQSNIKPQIKALLNAADMNYRAKQTKKALEQNNYALFLLKKSKSTSHWDYVRVYSQLFYNYASIENIDTHRLEECLLNIESIVKSKDYKIFNPEIERLYLQNKADYLWITKAYEESLAFYTKVLKYNLDFYNEDKEYFYAQNIVFEAYMNFFKIYIQQKSKIKATNALKVLQNFIRQRSPLNDFEQEIFLSHLIEYYFLLEDLEQVKKYSYELYQLKSRILTLGVQAIDEIAISFELKEKNKEISHLHENISNTHLKLQRNRIIILGILLITLLLILWIITIYFLYERKKQKQKMEKIILEQRLLRVQMEPHFIFNTLSVLQGFIRANDIQKSLNYLHQFSRLLRGSLELSRVDFIPLVEEIKLLDHYITLQQMQWVTPFKYSIHYEDVDVHQTLIPPMLIQPFVENSIKHGFKKKREDAEIIINLKKDDDSLYIEILDNGESDYKNEETHHSLAINITKERLKLLSGNIKRETDIFINQTGKGYQVTIKLFLYILDKTIQNIESV